MLKQDRALLQRKIEDAVERSREAVMPDVTPSPAPHPRLSLGLPLEMILVLGSK